MINSLIIVGLVGLAVGIGYRILTIIKFHDGLAITLSLSYITGVTILILIAVVLGLFGQLKASFVLVIFSSLGLLFSKTIYYCSIQFIQAVWATIQTTWQTARWKTIMLAVVGIVIGNNFLAVFVPPSAPDEVSYHYPEAIAIATSHTLPLPADMHYFYSNFPLYMETASAIGLLFGRYSVGHAVHYFFFLSLLLFLFGWLKKRYQLTTAIIGISSFLFLNDFWYLATTGYVDIAVVTVQVIGILLLMDWTLQRHSHYLWLSGVMFGIALSIKYTAALTVGWFIAYVIAIHFFYHRKGWAEAALNLSKLILPIIVIAGFWYGKNFYLYSNPFYPLYFGHPGIDEATYQNLLEGIQLFYLPRTITYYLLIPIHLFWNTLSQQGNPAEIIYWLAFLSIPWLVTVIKYRWQHLVLLFYIFTFSIYWYFFATQQLRVFFVPLVLFIILGSITISHLARRQLLVYSAIAIITLCSLVIMYPKTNWSKAIVTINPNPPADENLVFGSIRLDAALYVLGDPYRYYDS